MKKIAIFTMDVEDFGDTFCLQGKSDGLPSAEDGAYFFLKECEAHGAKATLFAVMEHYERDKALLQYAKTHGHHIGVHGFRHARPSEMGREAFGKELSKAKAVYREAFLEDPKFFRAPGWAIDDGCLEELKEQGFLLDNSRVPHSGKYPMYVKAAPLEGYKEVSPNLHEKDGFFTLDMPSGRLLWYKQAPLGGGVLIRFASWLSVRQNLKAYLKTGKPFVFVAHPLEFSLAKLPDLRKRLNFHERYYVAARHKGYRRRLRKIFRLLKKMGYALGTYEDLLKE